MKIKAIKVKKENAQKTINLLKENNNFNNKYKIIKEDNYVIIPIFEITDNLKKFENIILNDPIKQNKITNIEDLLKNKIPKEIIKEVPRSYDIAGDIIILKMPEDFDMKYMKIIGDAFIKLHPNIKVILNKKSEHKGVFRTQDMEVIYGENRKETIIKENNCKIKVDLEKVFYSTRLASERKRISKLVKKNEIIGVFFAGVGPFALTIAKNKNIKKIIAIELNPIAVKYMIENIKLNNLEDKIIPILGDVKEISKKYMNYFDRIVMPLPMTAGNFLKSAINSSKDKAKIHIYRFVDKNNPFNETINLINKIAKENKVKIDIEKKIILKSYSSKIVEIVIDMKINK